MTNAYKFIEVIFVSVGYLAIAVGSNVLLQNTITIIRLISPFILKKHATINSQNIYVYKIIHSKGPIIPNTDTEATGCAESQVNYLLYS